MPRGKKNDSRVSALRGTALVTGRVEENKTIVNACLLDNAEAEPEESFWSTRGSSCDIVVECGYSIDKEMRLRPSAQSIVRRHRLRLGEQSGAGKSRVSTLLCVPIDEEVLQIVAADNAGQLSRLVRDIALQMRASEYDGVCLKLTATPTVGSGFFINTIRTIANRLSEGNITVSLLLPYELPGKNASP
ncbi:hypothetical protein MTO96_008512 [Rhipicephalus appendiculatus]